MTDTHLTNVQSRGPIVYHLPLAWGGMVWVHEQ